MLLFILAYLYFIELSNDFDNGGKLYPSTPFLPFEWYLLKITLCALNLSYFKKIVYNIKIYYNY